MYGDAMSSMDAIHHNLIYESYFLIEMKYSRVPFIRGGCDQSIDIINPSFNGLYKNPLRDNMN